MLGIDPRSSRERIAVTAEGTFERIVTMASSDTYKRAIGLYQAGMLDRGPSAKRSLTSSRTTLKSWICRRWFNVDGVIGETRFQATTARSRSNPTTLWRWATAAMSGTSCIRHTCPRRITTEIWCWERPPTSSCGRRVPGQCAWPSPRILAALHRTLVGLGPGFRAAGPFDITVSRLFCRLSRSPESPSGD